MHQKLSLVTACWASTIFTLLAPSVNLRAQSGPPPAAPAPAGRDGEVPVHDVVLFSSGVGFFQHEGTVSGNGQTELRFKTTQINDILKSLVLQDLDGGHVGVVTYPSQDPLEKTLGSFQVDISDNPSLGDLLNKLRGAKVSLLYTGGANGSENLVGTVLGVEEKQVAGGKDEAPLKKPFLNLVTVPAGIRALELDRVDRLGLEDPGLQDELNRALAAVAGARDQDKKPVEIHFNGQGERHVRIGYVVDTPIWRASYRLVLPDNDPAAPKEAPKNAKGTLQGWALVENQTDNDWKNVRLSLVSGRPISFIENLYTPLYVPRPTVAPELYASLRPQEYEGGQKAGQEDSTTVGGSGISTAEEADGSTVAAEASSTLARRQAKAPRGGSYAETRSLLLPKSSPLSAAPASPLPAIAPMDATDSVAPITEAAKVGELFQYTVGDVSLLRQRSAMIPILNDPIPVEKLSIYNESVLANHPLNGARLHNDTEDKKHLLQGPVTVFDGGSYAGDARLDDVPPGQTRLLSFGIDLQSTTLTKNLENQQSVQTGKIVKGVLQVTRKSVAAKEYSTENKSDHDKTLVIEHPVRAGWKLADTPAPVETTDKLYRFQQDLPAGKTAKFTVKEENVTSQSLALLPLTVEGTLAYSQTGEIPKAVRDALAKAATLKQTLAQTEQEISNRDAQVNTVTEEQTRIRENLKTVDKTSAYATRLLKKLDDQETQIDTLRKETATFRSKLDEQTRALNDYLNGLTAG